MNYMKIFIIDMILLVAIIMPHEVIQSDFIWVITAIVYLLTMVVLGKMALIEIKKLEKIKKEVM